MYVYWLNVKDVLKGLGLLHQLLKLVTGQLSHKNVMHLVA